MEKGVIRFEANISLRQEGDNSLGTRTEIKNLNSFRALADSIEYEIERQSAVLDAGGKVIQDTMGWSESRRMTISQRGKEEAHDYRYFPEPDLPPLSIDETWIEQISAELPELPDTKIKRYTEKLGLSNYEAKVLTEDRPVAEWFEATLIAGGDSRAVANWMINVLFGLMNEHSMSIDEIEVTPGALVSLIKLVDEGAVNSNTAKDVLSEMFLSGKTAGEIVEAKGLTQISDEGLIANVIEEILRDNPEQVAAYLGGKDNLRGWFVGQVMRATRGKANPGLVNALLSKALEKLGKNGD